MSDTIDNDALENKLSLVILKPQEGKTYICINSIITDMSLDIHIVLTMNTLSAGMQFFGRMEDMIGSKNIIVYNSKKETAGNCRYAKNSSDIIKLLKKHPEIKVIVCCAHKKRFSESLMEIFNYANDSILFMQQKRKFKLHIDEAHKYIHENRKFIRYFNNTEIVSKITGYTASPDPIFLTDSTDILFYSIYLLNVEKDFGMIRSTEYFGVKDCHHLIIENEITCDGIIDLYKDSISDDVSNHIIKFAMTDKERENAELTKSKKWYNAHFPFSVGNEKLLLCFIEHILPKLVATPDEFSYHFIPAYCRKITHYQVAEMILKHYNNANVIVINGNGIQLFRFKLILGELTIKLMKTDKEIRVRDENHKKQLLEPSFVIQTLIEETCNCPTFVTGLLCVGMSITLVNETLGNFDNIVMCHHHCKKEDLYQLCRFQFNYTKWSPENKSKIKQTRFVCLMREVYDICLDYESYVETLITEYGGKHCALNDVRDIEIVEPSETIIRRTELDSISVECEWKRFQVDGEDPSDDQLQHSRAEQYYFRKSGKNITAKSKPKKYIMNEAFLACSISKKVDRYTVETIEKIICGNKTWDSYFQLLPRKTKYASRMLIGYNSFEDSSKYTIFIKSAILPESLEVFAILEKHGKQRKSIGNDKDILLSDKESDEENDK